MNNEECVAVLERLAKITYWTNNEKQAIDYAIQALTQGEAVYQVRKYISEDFEDCHVDTYNAFYEHPELRRILYTHPLVVTDEIVRQHAGNIQSLAYMEGEQGTGMKRSNEAIEQLQAALQKQLR